MPDLAERFPENPILVPQVIAPSLADLKIECLLNPGVFRFDHRTWLLLRVAERPAQVPGKTILPIFRADGGMQLLEFDHDDPKLDRSDPRVYRYDGVDYLTTISHLRPVCSEDGIHFREQDAIPPLIGEGPFESYGMKIVASLRSARTIILLIPPYLRMGGRGAAQHAGLAGGRYKRRE